MKNKAIFNMYLLCQTMAEITLNSWKQHHSKAGSICAYSYWYSMVTGLLWHWCITSDSVCYIKTLIAEFSITNTGCLQNILKPS